MGIPLTLAAALACWRFRLAERLIATGVTIAMCWCLVFLPRILLDLAVNVHGLILQE